MLKQEKDILMRSVTGRTVRLLFSCALFILSCNNSSTNATRAADSVKAKLREAGQKIGAVAKTTGRDVKDDAKIAADSIAQKAQEAFNRNPDSSFAVKAAINNEKELKILEEGVEKGTNKELKSDAGKMIADHKKLKAELKRYASMKRYKLPDENEVENSDIKRINSNREIGNDWDNGWTSQLIDDHQNAINDFEKAQGKVKDHALNRLITNILPVLHKHLDMVNKLKNDLPR
jgi:predicted outer membrane protein